MRRCVHAGDGADRARGMIIVEFTLAFLPFMLLVLGIGQMMLLHAARLAAMHAANAAVRAAVVTLDDDERRYGGEARGTAARGSRRLREITRAAAGALVGVWPAGRNARGEATFASAIQSPSRQSALPGLLQPPGDGDRNLHVEVAEDGGRGMVTATVVFDYPCLVPLSRRVLCRRDNTRRLESRASLPNQATQYAYGGP